MRYKKHFGLGSKHLAQGNRVAGKAKFQFGCFQVSDGNCLGLNLNQEAGRQVLKEDCIMHFNLSHKPRAPGNGVAVKEGFLF